MAERTFILLEHVKQETKTNLLDYTTMITTVPPPWTDLQKIDFESQIDLLKENLASWMQYVDKIDEQTKRMRNDDETKQQLVEQIDDWKINAENCALLKNVKQAVFKATKYTKLIVPQNVQTADNTPSKTLVPIKIAAQNIQKFHGNYLNWKPFWQRFEVNIHSQAYSNVEKLDALFGLLEGKALREIQGFSIIDENYNTVIETITARFGNDERILFELQNQLSSIQPAKPNARSICDTVQSIHNMCRQLQNHGVDINNSTLKMDIIRKMPPSEQAELVLFSQTNPGTTTEFILAKMKEFELKAEINAQIQRETSYRSGNEFSKTNTPQRSPTKTFKCSFCNGDHFSSDCKRFSSVEDKIKELNVTNRCTKCAGNHTTQQCFAKMVCKQCGGKHYTFLCNPKGNTKTSYNTKNQANTFVTVEKQQGCLLAKEITVMNRETKKTAKAVVFFDSGSQRTYISNNLINQLKLQTVNTEHIDIQGIGGKRIYYESNLVELQIQTKDGYKDIFANSIKSIANTIPLIQINELNPAEYTVKDRKPDILIGMDYFFEFITSVKQNNGTFFVESSVGQMVAGKIPITKQTSVTTTVTEKLNDDTWYQSEKTKQTVSQTPRETSTVAFPTISYYDNDSTKQRAGGEGFAWRKTYSMAEWWKLHGKQYGSYEDQPGTLSSYLERKPD